MATATSDPRILLLSSFRADAVYLRRFVRYGTEGDAKMARDAMAAYRQAQSQARAQGIYWPITLSMAKLSACASRRTPMAKKGRFIVKLRCIVTKEVYCENCTEEQARRDFWEHATNEIEVDCEQTEVLSVEPNE